jgi:hypothetical protein
MQFWSLLFWPSARSFPGAAALSLGLAACSPAETGGPASGGAPTTGGAAATSGASATGGAAPTTGGSATGGVAPTTGGFTNANGGAAPNTGGSTQVTGGSGSAGSSTTGGSTNNGSGGTATGGSLNGGAGNATGGAISNSGGTATGGSSGGVAGSMTGGQAGASTTGGAAGTAGNPMHREIVMYNDANGGQLLYVNSEKPAMNWKVNSGTGRDLQLVGGGKVMLGKSGGWDEYQLSNGMRVGGVSSLSGTQSTHRLADGTTLVASIAGGGILLRMANGSGAVQRMITYAGYSYVRCVRPTKTGTFLVTADTKVFEGDATGNVIWEVTVPGSGRHVWKALRLADGNTAVATGYDKSLRIYSPQKTLLQTITAPDSVYPHFFADFRATAGGNFFVVNSQADRTEDRSIQLLEFSASGALVWQQKQPSGVGSLEAAIVLDGLDTSKLQLETEGLLVAAQ